VQVGQCHGDFSRIEASPSLPKAATFAQIVVQFASVEKVEYHVQLVLALEGKPQGHDEWMINLSENATLREGVLVLLAPNHHILL